MESFASLINSVKACGDYDDQLEEFICLVSELDAFNTEDDYISYRLRITSQVDELISTMMSLREVSVEESMRVTMIIQRFGYLFVQFIITNLTDFREIFLKVLDKDAIFYKTYKHSTTLFQEFANFAIEQYFDEFINDLQEECTRDRYLFFIKMLTKVELKTNQESINSILSRISTQTIQIMDEFTDKDIYTCSKDDLSLIMDIGGKIDETKKATINLAGKCFVDESLIKKIVGAKTISKLAQLNDNAVFIDWAVESKFADIIFKDDVHQEIYSILVDAITKYYEKVQISTEMINILFSKVKTMDSFTRDPYSKLIAKILAKSPTVAAEFIKEIQNTQIDELVVVLITRILELSENISDENVKPLIKICLENDPIDGFKNIWKQICEKKAYENVLTDFVCEQILNCSYNFKTFKIIVEIMQAADAQKAYLATIESIKKGNTQVIELIPNFWMSNVSDLFVNTFEDLIPYVSKYQFGGILFTQRSVKLNVSRDKLLVWAEKFKNIEVDPECPDIMKFIVLTAQSLTTNKGSKIASVDPNATFSTDPWIPYVKFFGIIKDDLLKTAMKISMFYHTNNDSFRQMFKLIGEYLSPEKLKLLYLLICAARFNHAQPNYVPHNALYMTDVKCTVGNQTIYIDDMIKDRLLRRVYERNNGFQRVHLKHKEDNIYEVEPHKEKTIVIEKEDDQMDVLEEMRPRIVELLDNEEHGEYALRCLYQMKTPAIENLVDKLKESKGNKFRYYMFFAKDNMTEEIANIIASKMSDMDAKGIFDACIILAANPIFTAETAPNVLQSINKLFAVNDIYYENATKIFSAAIKLVKNIDPQILSNLVAANEKIIDLVAPSFEAIENKCELLDALSKDAKNLVVIPYFIDAKCEYAASFNLAIENIENDNSMKVIKKIIETHPEISDDELEKAVSRTLNILPCQNGFMVINSVIDRPHFHQMIRDRLAELLSVETNTWNYDYEENKKFHNYTGLKNLGATCYMNSVLQCLFNNEAFRNIFLSSKYDEPWQKNLQLLFNRMKYTKRSYVDTETFCNTFKYFGSIINPKEQHDAQEFLEFLLNRLGDVSDLFKGEMSVKFQYNGLVLNEKTETFHILPLTAEKVKSLDKSLDYFNDEEIIHGYFSDIIGQSVDVVRHTVIKTPPEYLIVQLKRFSFDLQKYENVKLSNEIEIPKELNIKKICEVDATYELMSGIVHMGTPDHGHYKAVAELDRKYVKYNDTNVSYLDDKEKYFEILNGHDLLSEFFSLMGDVIDTGYIFFYKKKTAPEVKDETQCDEETQKIIEEENKHYINTQNAFNPSIRSIILAIKDKEVMEKFFFNVFIHSMFDDELQTLDIVNALSESNFKLDNPKYYDFIFDCLTSGKDEKIKSIIVQVVAKFGEEKLIDMFYDKMREVEKNWRSLNSLMEIIIQLGYKNLEKFDAKRLLMYSIDSLKRVNSAVYTKNANFSNICQIFKDHPQFMNEEIANMIVANASLILQSLDHCKKFMELVLTYNPEIAMQLAQNIVNGAPGPAAPFLAVTFVEFIKHVPTKMNEISKIYLTTSRVALDKIGQELTTLHTRKETDVLDSIIKNCQEMLYMLLTSDDYDANTKTETFCIYAFKLAGLAGIPAENERDQGDLTLDFSHSKFEIEYPEEILQFSSMLSEKIKIITANPKDYMTGPIQNKKYVTIVRNRYGMMHALDKIDANYNNISLDFVEALLNLKIKDDKNILEAIRTLEFKDEFIDEIKPRVRSLIPKLLDPTLPKEELNDRIVVVLHCFRKMFDDQWIREILRNQFVKDTLLNQVNVYIGTKNAITELIPMFKDAIREEIFDGNQKVLLDAGDPKCFQIYCKLGYVFPREIILNKMSISMNSLLNDKDDFQLWRDLTSDDKFNIDDPKIYSDVEKICQDFIKSINTEVTVIAELCVDEKVKAMVDKAISECKVNTEMSHYSLIVLKILIASIEHNVEKVNENGEEILNFLMKADDWRRYYSATSVVLRYILKYDNYSKFSKWMLPVLKFILERVNVSVLEKKGDVLEDIMEHVNNDDDIKALAEAAFSKCDEKKRNALIKVLRSAFWTKLKIIADVLGMTCVEMANCVRD